MFTAVSRLCARRGKDLDLDVQATALLAQGGLLHAESHKVLPHDGVLHTGHRSTADTADKAQHHRYAHVAVSQARLSVLLSAMDSTRR